MKNISGNCERTTDKMPENFFWIGFIKLILPKSKIIHCYRNSKDNCLSIFKNHFPGRKINFAYNMNEIIEYYNLYRDFILDNKGYYLIYFLTLLHIPLNKVGMPHYYGKLIVVTLLY